MTGGFILHTFNKCSHALTLYAHTLYTRTQAERPAVTLLRQQQQQAGKQGKSQRNKSSQEAGQGKRALKQEG